jgi:hypothetical protein
MAHILLPLGCSIASLSAGALVVVVAVLLIAVPVDWRLEVAEELGDIQEL